MSDDDPPSRPATRTVTVLTPPCRCCSDHRRRIRQLLAELNAMRSTAAKSMAIMTERVISDAAILEPRAFSCEEDHSSTLESAFLV